MGRRLHAADAHRGRAPSQPTELKILYDDKHVYFAIRAYDDPAKVHRYPGRRDDFAGDIVGVCFDSYNDKRTGFEFDLTAGGSKIDLILGNGETEWDTTLGRGLGRQGGARRARAGPPSSGCRSTSCATGRRTSRSGACTPGAGSTATRKRTSGSSSRARTPGACTSSASCTASAGCKRSRHVELLPHVVGKASSGPSRPGRGHRRLGRGRARRQARAHDQLHARRHRQPRLRPGRGRPVGRQPHRLRDLLRGEAAVLPRGPEDPELRARGRGPALLLAPHRRRRPRCAAARSDERDGPACRRARRSWARSRSRARRAAGSRSAVLQSLHPEGDGEVASPLGRASAVVEPFGSYTVARLHKDWGKGNTSLGGMLTSTHRLIDDPPLASCRRRRSPAGSTSRATSPTAAWCSRRAASLSHVSGRPRGDPGAADERRPLLPAPDAGHLGVDPEATSLSGHGGSVRFGRRARGGCGSPTTSTGTRPASSSTTSATCARPT